MNKMQSGLGSQGSRFASQPLHFATRKPWYKKLWNSLSRLLCDLYLLCSRGKKMRRLFTVIVVLAVAVMAYNASQGRSFFSNPFRAGASKGHATDAHDAAYKGPADSQTDGGRALVEEAERRQSRSVYEDAESYPDGDAGFAEPQSWPGGLELKMSDELIEPGY
jgi:hypothetical protein